jgi:excisionase family DNA binding protein
MTERQLYTIREICERNSVSRMTVWRLIRAGKLDKVVLGAQLVRVTAESERRWIGAHSPTYRRDDYSGVQDGTPSDSKPRRKRGTYRKRLQRGTSRYP